MEILPDHPPSDPPPSLITDEIVNPKADLNSLKVDLDEIWRHFPPKLKEALHDISSQEELDFQSLFEHAFRHTGPPRGDDLLLALSFVGRDECPGVTRLRLQHNNVVYFSEKGLKLLCSNLSSNSRVEQLDLSDQKLFGQVNGCQMMGQVLETNHALKRLYLRGTELNAEAAYWLMSGLKQNSTLEELDISSNSELGDGGINYVANMLKSNTTLKVLKMHATGCTLSGAKLMADALVHHNTSLRWIAFGGNRITQKGMDTLFQSFITSTTDGPSHLKAKSHVTCLELRSTVGHQDCSVDSVAQLLKSSDTLLTLDISGAVLKEDEWLNQIIPALEENGTLKVLILAQCRGLSEKVFRKLHSLISRPLTASMLEQVDLKGTDIQKFQGALTEEMRKNKEYRRKFRTQEMVDATSARLVLCGFEYAGKTTVAKTMRHVSHGWKLALPEGKDLLRRHPKLRRFLFGSRALKELQYRTRGFDIVLLSRETKQKICVWDFAGQKEYYALHDYLFPGTHNSCFLYVCSPRYPPSDKCPIGDIKKPQELEGELLYWMRFIASNSSFRIQADRLPLMSVVLTKKDTLTEHNLDTFTRSLTGAVHKLIEKFEGVIVLNKEVRVVDAHSAKDVKGVLQVMEKHITSDLLWQQKEYAVCQKIRENLAGLSQMQGPILSKQDFLRVCKSDLDGAELWTESQLDSLLTCLNDAGDIIFTSALEFIVVNPRWFGQGVLGSLIDAFNRKYSTLGEAGNHEWKGALGCFFSGQERDHHREWPCIVHHQGFITQDHIQDLLETSLRIAHLKDVLKVDELIKLMRNLELCFDENAAVANSRLFMPVLFDDEEEAATQGKRQLRWELQYNIRDRVKYIGRRLECENKDLTFLTPGFFPRLQVVLHNYIKKQHWAGNTFFKVDSNLVRFAENGIEVLVEYNNTAYFLDILVGSNKPFMQTLQFVEQHVVKVVQEFCASPQGCQGVILVEAIIRPICVENLYPCSNRTNQAVLVSDLREKMQEYEAQGGKMEDYQFTWYEKLQDVPDMDYAMDLLEGDRSFQPVSVPIKVIYQHPRLFFPTLDTDTLSNFAAKFDGPGIVIPIKVHLMCEWREGPHKVDNQPGRKMVLKGNKALSIGTRRALINYATRITCTALKVVMATTTGMRIDPSVLEGAVQGLMGTPECPISTDLLTEIARSVRFPDYVVETKDILLALEVYLKTELSADWLKEFLRVEDPAFFHDFQLRKVDHQNEAFWLCSAHHDQLVLLNIFNKN